MYTGHLIPSSYSYSYCEYFGGSHQLYSDILEHGTTAAVELFHLFASEAKMKGKIRLVL